MRSVVLKHYARKRNGRVQRDNDCPSDRYISHSAKMRGFYDLYNVSRHVQNRVWRATYVSFLPVQGGIVFLLSILRRDMGQGIVQKQQSKALPANILWGPRTCDSLD